MTLHLDIDFVLALEYGQWTYSFAPLCRWGWSKTDDGAGCTEWQRGPLLVISCFD